METDLKLPNLLITGTPGVGKTSLAMLLTDRLNENLNSNSRFIYVNIGKLITEKKLYKDWNKEFDVPEFEDELVYKELEPIINEGGAIFDFHSCCFFNDADVKYVILLRCNNTILYDRLKGRGYTDKKITENIECEIMEVTSDDVREVFKEEKIIEMKSESIDDMQNILEVITTKVFNN